MLRPGRRAGLAAGVLVSVAATVLLSGRLLFGLSPAATVTESARVAGAAAFGLALAGDVTASTAIAATYFRGDPHLTTVEPGAGWSAVRTVVPGTTIVASLDPAATVHDVPFVYEDPDEPYLRDLRERYDLTALVTAEDDEYSAMLAVGGWLGRQFDHGADRPAGEDKACDPVSIIERGRAGARFSCEITSLTMVHVASALGWAARLTTASLTGYTWDHGISELWSNQFRKWFVLDTDFNVVYEVDGVPQSAAELMTQGAALRRAGRLRLRRIAEPKASIPDPTAEATLGLYKYVHTDMRNDWCARPLQRGSPAGGDRATWWMAPSSFPRLLTARRRVTDAHQFDWPVDQVTIHATGAAPAPGGAVRLTLALTAYSPRFVAFEYRVDDTEWQTSPDGHVVTTTAPGPHVIEARVRSVAAFPGPTSTVHLTIATASPAPPPQAGP